MKNQRKSISTEEKFDIISHLEKGEQIVDIWSDVRFNHSSIHSICDNADRITDGAKSGPEVFSSNSTTVLYQN